MGNLARFRGNILIFSLGLLFVVSLVFGDEHGPGADDGAAASASGRAASPSPASSGEAQPQDVAMALNKAKPSNRWFAKDQATSGLAQGSAASDASQEAAAPSPDGIQIHN